MSKSDHRLCVALLVGTLGQGGAEKQLVYMARALAQSGANVRVYCLTQGEFYESVLQAYGIPVIWSGKVANPLVRLGILLQQLSSFSPHIIQSTHPYINLYTALTGRLLNAVSLGAMRSSLYHSRQGNGAWTPWLIKTPHAIVANSQNAYADLIEQRLVQQQHCYMLSNVIDLSEFDNQSTFTTSFERDTEHIIVAFVGRLIPVKRLDRFLRVLALSCQHMPDIRGLVIGDGPEYRASQALAEQLMGADTVTFLGNRHDVPGILTQFDILILTSDSEGFPNVLLEAMAARLPVITTPAGDAGTVVVHEVTGYVQPYDDILSMAECIVRLAQSPDLRRQLGQAGRRRVEEQYSFEGLAENLLAIYDDIARRYQNQRLLHVLQHQTEYSADR